MKIVIVEDDALIAYQIEACATKHGHEILASFDEALDALAFIANHKIDFVFMDIELKGPMDGIQCARELRAKYQVPSLFVTSHDAAETIAEAASVYPLNFLAKPFTDKNIEISLTLAETALQNIRNAHNTPTTSTISLSEYSFNFEYNILKRKNSIVKLTTNEIKLISLLFKNLGNTVSNEEILNYIWQDKTPSSAAFRKHISRTNEKLFGLAIVSDRGVGYSIIDHS